MTFKIAMLLTAAMVATPCYAQAVDPTEVATSEPATDTILVTARTVDDRAVTAPQPLADRLLTLPGVSITQYGAPGSTTALRIRGAESEQTLVTIDGVVANDPASPAGGFDFGPFRGAMFDKVTLVSGPSSLLWGSQAIGGVVQLESGDRTDPMIHAEVGSRATRALDAAMGARHPKWGQWAIGAGAFRTDGFSNVANGTEADSSASRYARGTYRVAIGGGWHARASAMTLRSRVALDGYPAPDFTLADTAEIQHGRFDLGTLMLAYDGARVDHRLLVGRTQSHRRYQDPSISARDYFTAHGRITDFRYDGRWRFGSHSRLDVGIARLESDFQSDSGWSMEQQDTAIQSGHALLTVTPLPAIEASLGIRHDDHKMFGGHNSIAGAVRATTASGMTLRLLYNEGFKVPTLAQLSTAPFGYGNDRLAPETTAAWEVGIGRDGGLFAWDALMFTRDTRHQIDFAPCPTRDAPPVCANGSRPYGTYFNILSTRARGLEVSATWRPTAVWSINAHYSYVDARNRTAGDPRWNLPLARRPRHKAHLGIAHHGAVDWGASARLMGRNYDDAYAMTSIDGHIVGDIWAAYPVTAALRLTARVENVTNAEYEWAKGYAATPRGVFVGLSWQ